jgi:UDP-N-acetylglucosamine acyltransferase
MCDGHPAKVYNLNLIGLRRAKMPVESISLLKQSFKILFHSELSKTNALEKLEKEVETCPEVEHLIFFAKTTKRGLCG